VWMILLVILLLMTLTGIFFQNHVNLIDHEIQELRSGQSS
jgi:hypothetical protein